jgi:chromosome segregation ATPase
MERDADSVTDEKNIALINQTNMNRTFGEKFIQISELKVLLEDSVSLQQETLANLDKCKLSLESSSNRTVELEKQLLVLHNERDLLTSKKNSQDSELTKCHQHIDSASQRIQLLGSQVENYKSASESANKELTTTLQSLKSLELVADTIPALKDTLQKSINAFKQSQRKVIDLKSQVEAASNSLEKKIQEFIIATKRFEDEIGKEQRRYYDLSNNIVHSLASIQTGSEKLNEEWKVAFQGEVDEGCSVTELFDMLQELVDHINSKYSSDQDNLTNEHLKEVSALKGEIAGLRNALNTKATEINSSEMEDVVMNVDLESHQPEGNHPLFGMMNLRGCEWYWSPHCLVH